MLKQLARSAQGYVVEIRRHLHANPELRFQEEKTLDFIKSKVSEFTEIQPFETKGGIFYNFIFSESHNDQIIFRADVDAVPVPEETGLSFASKVSGVSHACGHDVHVAMLLGAMKLLSMGEIKTKHNIRFVFQRAEENPSNTAPISGGAELVNAGVCNGISSAYALHIWASGESGIFESRPGGFLANSGRMKVVVKTTGGHVAFPHMGSNATNILVDICTGLRGFAARHLGGLEPVVLEPASLNSGELGSSNTRPAQGEVWFAVRHFLNPDRCQKFQKALTEKVKSIVSGYPDATLKVTHVNGHPALINSPEKFDHVSQVLTEAGEKVQTLEPIFGGEDFAHYLNKVPGGIWMLGVNQEGCGGHHTPTFNPDESVFWKGVLFWLLLATN